MKHDKLKTHAYTVIMSDMISTIVVLGQHVFAKC